MNNNNRNASADYWLFIKCMRIFACIFCVRALLLWMIFFLLSDSSIQLFAFIIYVASCDHYKWSNRFVFELFFFFVHIAFVYVDVSCWEFVSTNIKSTENRSSNGDVLLQLLLRRSFRTIMRMISMSMTFFDCFWKDCFDFLKVRFF